MKDLSAFRAQQLLAMGDQLEDMTATHPDACGCHLCDARDAVKAALRAQARTEAHARLQDHARGHRPPGIPPKDNRH